MATFSVVTPNMNMGRFLAPTIESVLLNLRPGDEYFIIDGDSSDDSKEVIARYAARVTGWVSEKDRGYADALRKGFSKCSGDYLCWINSGDLLLDGALDVARTELAQSGVDLIMGDDLYIDEEDIIISQSRGRIILFKHMMLFGPWTPLQDACFWTRSFYDRLGGINPELRSAADYEFFLRAAWFGRSKYTPIVYSAFRRHRGQKSILDSPRYREEQSTARRVLLLTLGSRKLQHFFLRPLCWVYVRLRHHLLQRFFATWVRGGGNALMARVSSATDIGNHR